MSTQLSEPQRGERSFIRTIRTLQTLNTHPDNSRVQEFPADTTTLTSERDEIKSRSTVFKKELGLRDLVLTQVMYVVGTAWVGTAAKLGHAHIIFWLLAILLFYLPQGAVVVYLNRLMPLEGGIYQWAKLGFNNFAGFIVAWNLWVYSIIVMSAMGLVITAGLGYATGATWLASNKLIVATVSAVMMVAMVLATLKGLSLGKWVHNAGGVMIMGAFALLIALPFWHVARHAARVSPVHDDAANAIALEFEHLRQDVGGRV